MRAILVLILFLSLPYVAGAAEEALKHAETWELKRDGAWIFNFLLLFAGVYYLVKRFIIPALSERSERIARQLEEAEKLRMETMKTLSDIEYKTRVFEKETAKAREESIEAGNKIKEQIIAEAVEMAKRVLEKAQIEIQSETIKAKDALRRETAELAMKLASELLEKSASESDQKKMIDEYLEQIGKSS